MPARHVYPGCGCSRPLFILGLCHSACNADPLAVPTGMQLNTSQAAFYRARLGFVAGNGLYG